jgi:predicted anti-sigma-YlaC factor YlaD
MLDCEQVTVLCSEELDRKLPVTDRIALRLHMMMCRGCSNYRAQLAVIRAAMQRYAAGGASTIDDAEAKRP